MHVTQRHLELGNDLSSARRGRAALGELLAQAGWGETDAADAALVMTELITNAVVHGGGLVDVIVDLDDDRVRFEIADLSSAEPRLREPDLAGGRGLLLVSHLSDRWGVDDRPSRSAKVVWCELAATRPASWRGGAG